MAKSKKVAFKVPTKPNAKVFLTELRQAAEAEGNEGALGALADAELNAYHTAEENPNEVHDIAERTLGSISFTSAFSDDRKVSDWFEAHGYRW